MIKNKAMEQYIRKSDIVAEIERKIEEYQSAGDDYWFPVIENLKNILSFLNTLETEEVGFKKELDYNNYMNFFKKHPEYSNRDWGFDECWVFAKYFYELGLKAQKGE